jgi:hypothetical protein
MTEPPEANEPEEVTDEDSGSRAVSDLLKRSLSVRQEDAPDLLVGVQRIIRKRSRGKFFADGWSTTQTRTSYLLIGLVTLLLVAVAYYALGTIEAR